MIARIQKAMKEKDGGFTLVELIVVVIIIGVLAAIAVPVFLHQTTEARKKSDIAALSNAKIAVASWIAEGNAAAPSQADLLGYGGPPTTSGAIAVNPYNATAGTYTVTLTGGASSLTCTAKNDQAPAC